MTWTSKLTKIVVKVKNSLYGLYSKEIFSPVHGYPHKIFKTRTIYLYTTLYLRKKKNEFKYGKEAVPDPFEIIYVDPDKIKRFSGREAPPHRKLFRDIGTIKGGDWDKKTPEDKKEEYIRWHNDKWYYKFYFGSEKFNQTLLSNYLEAFIEELNEDHEIEKTQLYNLLKDKNKDYINTEEYVKSKAKLYNSISENGIIPAQKLNNKFDISNFDDIIVDISRDKELLFVDGRHRLVIAKQLELEKIPVRVGCLHQENIN